jgi:LPS-assembly protein
MKSKFLNSFFLLIWIFFSYCYVNADEAFTFNVAEIEILENGKRINGTNGGTVISNDGSTITGKNFFYNKQTNILEITENVKYSNNIKNIVITADKIIYHKNDEKIFTIGNSKIIEENNNISANELEYDKNLNTFKAKKNAEIHDHSKDTKIYADEISYIKGEEKIYTKGKTKALIQKNINLILVTLLILEITKIYFLKKNHP